MELSAYALDIAGQLLLSSVATLVSILVAPDFSFAASAVLFFRNH